MTNITGSNFISWSIEVWEHRKLSLHTVVTMLEEIISTAFCSWAEDSSPLLRCNSSSIKVSETLVQERLVSFKHEKPITRSSSILYSLDRVSFCCPMRRLNDLITKLSVISAFSLPHVIMISLIQWDLFKNVSDKTIADACLGGFRVAQCLKVH